MISKIALAYNADPDEYTRKVARKATIEEGIMNALVFAAENGVLEDIGMQIKADLANEFGTEFLTTLMQEALGESADVPGPRQSREIGRVVG